MFDFDVYQRPFKKPLHTSHGLWKIREGIIISLTDKTGKIAQGEIAPLPWFGSETLTQARQFCDKLGNKINQEKIAAIPDNLPACQFAFESALENLERNEIDSNCYLNYCYLLPAGTTALKIIDNIISLPNSYSINTFKWKIGVLEITEEIEILRQLVAILSPNIKLRLDANGGLNLQQAQNLLEVTENISMIEYIEQPLPPEQFTDILFLDREYSTPLALDESVASLPQLQEFYLQGWQGIYVIKAAIMGFPSRLRQFCQNNTIDAVFSSVFETKIGRKAVLSLAAELSNKNRAVGFGVEQWFVSNE